MSDTTDHNKQAQDFLKSTGTAFKPVYLKHGSHFAGESDTRDIYRITLSNSRGKWSFNFGQSAAKSNGHTPPTAYDVLASITKYDPGTFDNFCSEFGYDPSLKDSKKTYNAVVKEWDRVNDLFTDEEIEQLREIQ